MFFIQNDEQLHLVWIDNSDDYREILSNCKRVLLSLNSFVLLQLLAIKDKQCKKLSLWQAVLLKIVTVQGYISVNRYANTNT